MAGISGYLLENPYLKICRAGGYCFIVPCQARNSLSQLVPDLKSNLRAKQAKT
jgi:hypothetical protein